MCLQIYMHTHTHIYMFEGSPNIEMKLQLAPIYPPQATFVIQTIQLVGSAHQIIHAKNQVD